MPRQLRLRRPMHELMPPAETGEYLAERPTSVTCKLPIGRKFNSCLYGGDKGSPWNRSKAFLEESSSLTTSLLASFGNSQTESMNGGW